VAEPRFTRGTWRHDGLGVVTTRVGKGDARKKLRIAVCCLDEQPADGDENSGTVVRCANADLIAAAPDLYFMCDSALCCLQRIRPRRGDDSALADIVIDMMSDALAKARGEQP
jgi:hypothetical protein